MSSQTPPGGDPGRPSFAEENALRIASEALTHYDEAPDTYHCSYRAAGPAVTVGGPRRGRLGGGGPRSREVVGFSIPDFKAWSAANATEGGEFEVDLPSVWPPEGAAGGGGDQHPRGACGGGGGGGLG